MTGYVLDASVAVKWFLPAANETLVEEAAQILQDYAGGRLRLLVPDLFWPECGNVLWKAVRLGRIARRSAEEALGLLAERQIATAPCRPLLPGAFAIASAFDRSVYDGVYVALAVASGLPLLTADERLATALAARFPIRWLGAW